MVDRKMVEQSLLHRIAKGRPDLVFDWVAVGLSADSADLAGVPLIRWCAYYGDVSAVRYLLGQGVSLERLGDNLDLNGAAFHGHWQLCEFLIEQGADPNATLPETLETPLHAALTKRESVRHERVVQVLLSAGAEPNRYSHPGVETAAFMRDVRTAGETPLHRAAAFGTLRTIMQLLDAGADPQARDAHGDSPLSWASRALRSTDVLRLLCFPPHSVRADRVDLSESLIGQPAL